MRCNDFCTEIKKLLYAVSLEATLRGLPRGLLTAPAALTTFLAADFALAFLGLALEGALTALVAVFAFTFLTADFLAATFFFFTAGFLATFATAAFLAVVFLATLEAVALVLRLVADFLRVVVI